MRKCEPLTVAETLPQRHRWKSEGGCYPISSFGLCAYTDTLYLLVHGVTPAQLIPQLGNNTLAPDYNENEVTRIFLLFSSGAKK